MKYENVYELNENGLAKICPKCKNEEIADDAEYCEICGASLINRCTNPECGVIGSGKARFCKKCGSETEFGKRGYLKAWDAYKDEDEIDVDETHESEIDRHESDGYEETEVKMVEIEIAKNDEFDDNYDEAPEIERGLGDFDVVYNQDEEEKKETYDRFQDISYKGGDEFFEIF